MLQQLELRRVRYRYQVIIKYTNLKEREYIEA